MKRTLYIIYLLPMLLLSCSSVKQEIHNYYGLEGFTIVNPKHFHGHGSLFISLPEATAGFTTEAMRYTTARYQLESFTHNAWYSPPADMLLPLMVKSISKSHLFKGIASGVYADPTDYRLDTQLIELKQSFHEKTSVLDLIIKVVLTNVANSQILGSTILQYHIPCQENTPYGGVKAANEATKRFTAELTQFIMLHLT